MEKRQRNYTLRSLGAMIAFGVLIGLVFPPVVDPFVTWIPERKIWFRVLCMAAGLTVGGVGYFIVWYILVRRVKLMAESLRDICLRDGDLTRSIPVESRDVSGQIATWFNQNVSHLKEIVTSIRDTGERMDASLRLLEGEVTQAREAFGGLGSGTGDMARFLTALGDSSGQVLQEVLRLSSLADQASASIAAQEERTGEIDGRADDMLGAIQETVAAMEELMASIRQVAENAAHMSTNASGALSVMERMGTRAEKIQVSLGETSRSSQQVVTEAQGGAERVRAVVEAIAEIDAQSREATRIFGELARAAESIGEIISFMRGIGEETNLLALNASIIAAQAGNEGRAFGVVAGEIRDLSEKTAASVREVAGILKGIQEGIKRAHTAVLQGQEGTARGVSLSSEAGEALERILVRIRESQSRLEPVGSLANEQATASREAAEAVTRVAGLAGEVARATREQGQGTQRIAETSQVMQNLAASVKSALASQREEARRVAAATAATTDLVREVVAIHRQQTARVEEVGELMDRLQRMVASGRSLMDAAEGDCRKASGVMEELVREIHQFRL